MREGYVDTIVYDQWPYPIYKQNALCHSDPCDMMRVGPLRMSRSGTLQDVAISNKLYK